jgi:subtilisin family serine protease
MATSASAATRGITPVDDPIAGSYVVTLDDSVTNVTAAAARLAASTNGRLGFLYSSALKGFSIQTSRSGALELTRSPLVTRVQEDGRLHAVGTQTNAIYGLDRLDQRNLPLNQTFVYANDGAGVHAYDIDTGIRPTHSNFEGRASIGADFVGDGQNGNDCNGHGTHTAGTIGSETYGVAKGVSLVGIRVLDCQGSGSSSAITAGINWVTAHAIKPAVANMSLGTTSGRDTTIENAVTNSIASGVSYAVAAGNGVGNGLGISEDACTHSPSATPNAITVSATDSTDTKPGWANTGTCVDIFAPGVNILSTWYTNDTATMTESGTSMSTPEVAGAVALYLAANPSATPAQVASALTTNATAGVVKSGGSGSPNKLLYTAFIGGGGTPPPNNPPAAGFTKSCSGLSCTFTDTSTDSDGTIASRSWNFGDGTTATTSPATHAYAAAGTYTVTLTVTDNSGASASTSQAVTVTTTGGGGTDPDPATPNLTSGVATSGTGAATGGWKYYKIQVPAGKSSLKTDLTGPSCGLLSCAQDLDLFVRQTSKPTTTVYGCSSAGTATTETCTISSPAAAYYYVGVYTYAGSGASFTIKATVS